MSSAYSPFGPGTPLPATAPPEFPAERAAYMDPRTRDYVLDSESELSRMPVVRQQILLALTTKRGSSTVDPGFGIELPKKIDENIATTMRNAVERATAHITSAGRASITDVTVERHMLGVRTIVSYNDLTLGTTDFVTF
jgi:phage baseplate assembly protein W